MTSKWRNLTFGIDLVQSAQYQLKFLKEIDRIGNLYEGKYFNKALYRYEKIWIPLIAKSNVYLIPPIDVEWVWHVHRLSPGFYFSDMRNLANKDIDKPLNNEIDIKYSKQLWENHYSNISYDYLEDDSYLNKFQSKIKYDLKAASLRQKNFIYQVSLPHFESEEFLRIGVDRYKMFLYLRKMYPTEFLVPCYLIDIIWHSHQLQPSVYKTDTEKLLGAMLAHDDSVTDRSYGSKLSNSFKRTREIWKKEFNENFFQAGAMFRGNAIDKEIYQKDGLSLFNLAKPLGNFRLEYIEIHTKNKQNELQLPEFKVNIHKMSRDNLESLYSFNLKPNINGIQVETEYDFKFDKQKIENIYITLEKNIYKITDTIKSLFIDTEKIRFSFDLNSVNTNADCLKHQEYLFTDNDTKVEYCLILKWHVSKKYENKLTFYLKNDQLNEIDKNKASGLMEPLKALIFNKISQLKNIVIFKSNSKLFLSSYGGLYDIDTIVVFKPLIAAFQISLEQKAIITSKFIGKEQLPNVNYPPFNLSLNPKTQKALLVQNHNGDFAIVKMQFLNKNAFEQFKPAFLKKILKIEIYYLLSRKIETIVIEKDMTFKLQNEEKSISAEVDFRNNLMNIQFEDNSQNFEEFLALILSIKLLHRIFFVFDEPDNNVMFGEMSESTGESFDNSDSGSSCGSSCGGGCGD